MNTVTALKTTAYLENRLIVETLGSAPDASGRFRSGDERGEVAMIISNAHLQYVELAEFSEKGVKRGYHYHTHFLEHLYIITGRLLVAACLIDREHQINIIVNSGDLITITPGVAHAFLSINTSLVLSMGSGADPFLDRHQFKNLRFPEHEGT